MQAGTGIPFRTPHQRNTSAEIRTAGGAVVRISSVMNPAAVFSTQKTTLNTAHDTNSVIRETEALEREYQRGINHGYHRGYREGYQAAQRDAGDTSNILRILPCRLGIHQPGPWQCRDSNADLKRTPPEWQPRMRVCQRCGRIQYAHRSVDPPYRMKRQGWR